MAEYVKRTDILRIVDTFHGARNAYHKIKDIPAEDVVPVVHGKWIDKGWDGDSSWQIDGRGHCWHVYVCSNCGGNLCGAPRTNYCSNCGAKMDLED